MSIIFALSGASLATVDYTESLPVAVDAARESRKGSAHALDLVGGKPVGVSLALGVLGTSTYYLLSSVEPGALLSGFSQIAVDVGETERGAAQEGLDALGIYAPRSFPFTLDAGRRLSPGSPLTLTIGEARGVASHAPFALETIGTGKNSLPLAMRLQGTSRYSIPISLSTVQTGTLSPGWIALDVGETQRSGGAVALDISGGQSVQIIVDILSAILALAGDDVAFIRSRAFINGAEKDVSGFSITAPPDKLGVSCAIALAYPLEVIPLGASIRLDVGIYSPEDDTTEWGTLFDTGRVAGRSVNINFQSGEERGFPGDTLDITGTSRLMDKWRLRPAVPYTMYDPLRVVEGELEPDLANAIHRANGTTLTPEFDGYGGLNLYTLLNRAYTAQSTGTAGVGCGFTRVVTNLPNYPIRRADFGVNGWHAGVLPYVAPFTPLYYEDSGTLYIWDTLRGMPPGVASISLPLTEVTNANYADTPSEIINSLIVSYKEEAAADEGNYYVEYPGQTSPQWIVGAFGEDGSSRQDTTPIYRETHNISNPSRVLDKEILQTETRTYTQIDGALLLVSKEIERDTFTGARKTGWRRTVDARVPDVNSPDAPQLLQQVYEETGTLFFVFNGREWIQTKTITQKAGLVLEEEGATEDKPLLTPIVTANLPQNRLIDADAGQSASFRPIEAIVETFIEKPGGMVTILRQVFDRLEGSYKGSEERTYAGSVRTPGTRLVTRQEIIEDTDSIALDGNFIPASLDAGELPQSEAIPLAQRKLREYRLRPQDTTQEVDGIRFTLRRGSLIHPANRSGATSTLFVVKGWTVTARALGTDAARISTSVTASQLLPNA